MRRIGIAASKIAKGNLFYYNLCVVFISFAFSLLMFFVSGSAIFFALVIIGYIVEGILPSGFDQRWVDVVRICMAALTVVVGLLTLFAISINIKIGKD